MDRPVGAIDALVTKETIRFKKCGGFSARVDLNYTYVRKIYVVFKEVLQWRDNCNGLKKRKVFNLIANFTGCKYVKWCIFVIFESVHLIFNKPVFTAVKPIG